MCSKQTSTRREGKLLALHFWKVWKDMRHVPTLRPKNVWNAIVQANIFLRRRDDVMWMDEDWGPKADMTLKAIYCGFEALGLQIGK